MPFRVSTVETIDGIDRELNSLTIDHVGDYSLDFVPHGSTVNVVWTKAVSSPPTVTLTVLGLHFGHWTYEPGEVYVQLCNSRDPYEFGFNGKYKDNEIAGTGNSLDFGARMYSSRLGRWMSLDPKAAKYPALSPYVFAGDAPIVLYDPNGEEIRNAYYNYSNDGKRLGLVNPDVQELADFVDKAIEDFKKDDAKAFEYFNQFDIVVQTGDLPQPEGQFHPGHNSYKGPEEGRVLRDDEAYEQEHGKGSWAEFGQQESPDGGPSPRSIWRQDYNKHPLVADKKGWTSVITLDKNRIEAYNSDKMHREYNPPGRTLKHELGHLLFTMKYYDASTGKASIPEKEDYIIQYENTYDGKSSTTQDPQNFNFKVSKDGR